MLAGRETKTARRYGRSLGTSCVIIKMAGRGITGGITTIFSKQAGTTTAAKRSSPWRFAPFAAVIAAATTLAWTKQAPFHLQANASLNYRQPLLDNDLTTILDQQDGTPISRGLDHSCCRCGNCRSNLHICCLQQSHQ